MRVAEPLYPVVQPGHPSLVVLDLLQLPGQPHHAPHHHLYVFSADKLLQDSTLSWERFRRVKSIFFKCSCLISNVAQFMEVLHYGFFSHLQVLLCKLAFNAFCTWKASTRMLAMTGMILYKSHCHFQFGLCNREYVETNFRGKDKR